MFIVQIVASKVFVYFVMIITITHIPKNTENIVTCYVTINRVCNDRFIELLKVITMNNCGTVANSLQHAPVGSVCFVFTSYLVTGSTTLIHAGCYLSHNSTTHCLVTVF